MLALDPQCRVLNSIVDVSQRRVAVVVQVAVLEIALTHEVPYILVCPCQDRVHAQEGWPARCAGVEVLHVFRVWVATTHSHVHALDLQLVQHVLDALNERALVHVTVQREFGDADFNEIAHFRELIVRVEVHDRQLADGFSDSRFELVLTQQIDTQKALAWRRDARRVGCVGLLLLLELGLLEHALCDHNAQQMQHNRRVFAAVEAEADALETEDIDRAVHDVERLLQTFARLRVASREEGIELVQRRADACLRCHLRRSCHAS